MYATRENTRNTPTPYSPNMIKAKMLKMRPHIPELAMYPKYEVIAFFTL
jgi:hypothetical protein